jgi:hypothetical protein
MVERDWALIIGWDNELPFITFTFRVLGERRAIVDSASESSGALPKRCAFHYLNLPFFIVLLGSLG